MSKLSLHGYQHKAVKFAIENPISYNSCDMGLGKTAIALNWIKHVLTKIDGGVLVIAPLRTVHSTWPEEIEKWAPGLTHTILHGSMRDVDIRKKRDIYLVNFEGLDWLLNSLKAIFKKGDPLPFRGMVIDEGSMLKSRTSKRFEIMKIMTDVSPDYKLILSGTPAPNGLHELWPQYFLLDKGWRLGRNITTFRSKYLVQIDTKGRVWGLQPGAEDRIHKAIADITFRLDGDDYLEMPERIDNIIKLVLPPKVMKKYKELEREFFLTLEDGSIVEAETAPVLGMKLRQFVQGALYKGTAEDAVKGRRDFEVFHKEKLKALTGIMDEANGQGVLCAIQFRFELEMILEKYPGTPVIASGTTVEQATDYIKRWNKGEIPLLLCHPASISHGVNLQAGSHIIVWFGMTWSLEQYLQFNARLYRQGQKYAVIIHHLIAKGTIDERVLRALKGKFKTQKSLLDYLREVTNWR